MTAVSSPTLPADADQPLIASGTPEADLHERLRVWRRRQGLAQGLPLYVVLPNRALVLLALRRPATPAALAAVPGLGTRRLAAYGAELLELIVLAAAELGLDVAEHLERAELREHVTVDPRMAAARALAAEAFAAGAPVKAVARVCARNVRTIEDWLVRWATRTRPATLVPWLDEATRARVLAVAARVGRGRLKPLFEALGGQVDYLQIRLALLAEQQAGAAEPQGGQAPQS